MHVFPSYLYISILLEWQQKQQKHMKKAQMFSLEFKKANQKLVQSDEWP